MNNEEKIFGIPAEEFVKIFSYNKKSDCFEGEFYYDINNQELLSKFFVIGRKSIYCRDLGQDNKCSCTRDGFIKAYDRHLEIIKNQEELNKEYDEIKMLYNKYNEVINNGR